LERVGDSDSTTPPISSARDGAFDPAFNRKGWTMKLVEPAFESGGDLLRALSNAPDVQARALNEKLVRQSAELNRRLTEILELHNLQQRQANELEDAYEEIGQLRQANSALQEAVTQYKVGATAAEDKISLLESEKASLQAQLDGALEESKILADRVVTAEAAARRSEDVVATSIKQIEFLNTELMTTSAERFKIVAAMQGEQKRQRSVFGQQKSILENKLQEKEALTATQGMKIKQLEGVRDELERRVRVIEVLLMSEREAAERKTGRTTETRGATG
jgi:chromosome segregation ATPase